MPDSGWPHVVGISTELTLSDSTHQLKQALGVELALLEPDKRSTPHCTASLASKFDSSAVGVHLTFVILWPPDAAILLLTPLSNYIQSTFTLTSCMREKMPEVYSGLKLRQSALCSLSTSVMATFC